MHMIMENVWLMSKWAAYNQREMENNGIKATLCVAPNIARFANKAPRVKDLDPIDINEVCEGKSTSRSSANGCWSCTGIGCKAESGSIAAMVRTGRH